MNLTLSQWIKLYQFQKGRFFFCISTTVYRIYFTSFRINFEEFSPKIFLSIFLRSGHVCMYCVCVCVDVCACLCVCAWIGVYVCDYVCVCVWCVWRVLLSDQVSLHLSVLLSIPIGLYTWFQKGTFQRKNFRLIPISYPAMYPEFPSRDMNFKFLLPCPPTKRSCSCQIIHPNIWA